MFVRKIIVKIDFSDLYFQIKLVFFKKKTSYGEVATWEIVHWGSRRLGKYPCEVAAWERVFWKVPNISPIGLLILKVLKNQRWCLLGGG